MCARGRLCQAWGLGQVSSYPGTPAVMAFFDSIDPKGREEAHFYYGETK